MLDSVWQDIDATFILAIDQADNGVATASQSHLALLVEAFNPTWDSSQSYDDAFLEAADFARGYPGPGLPAGLCRGQGSVACDDGCQDRRVIPA